MNNPFERLSKRAPQKPKPQPPFGDRSFIARVPDAESDYKADVYRIDWQAIEIEYLIDGRIIDHDAIAFRNPDAWLRAGYATQERIYAKFRQIRQDMS